MEWKDIDFKAKTLRIERTSQLVKKVGVVTKNTKTEQSRRIVDLNEYCIKLLKAYKIWQMERKLKLGDVWVHDTDRLFTQENGLPTCPDTVTTWFRKFIDKTDLPRIHVHSLRHINATLMISLGIDIRTISRQVADIPIVRPLCGVYSHFIHSAGQDAASKLEKMLL